MVKLYKSLTITLTALIFLTATSANAQHSLKGQTPSGLKPGAPAGSYSLSGFESVNAYNGNLNFNLPLVSVGGRGSAGTSVSLQLQNKWKINREVVDPNYNTIVNYPDYTGWIGGPAYFGATIEGRTGGNATVNCVSQIVGDRPIWIKSLTRLTVKTGDGTEYELRDTLSGGEPITVPKNMYQCPTANPARGNVFVTADGTSATFISDTSIYDDPFPETSDALTLNGYLLLKDGSRWRFDNNVVSWIRDRNGNKLTFSSGGGNSAIITDSLNRSVTVTPDVTDGTYGLCDKLVYKGFGGTTRTIYITKTTLANVLRSGQTLKTYTELFPSIPGASDKHFDPTVRGSVILPNGKSYQFKYNSYGELARVVLPTGGAIEYDWDVGESGNTDGGAVATGTYSDYGVYRRVMERRTYADGSTLESKMIYERAVDFNSGTQSYAIIETRDASNNLLGKQKSYFHGSARQSFSQVASDYGRWKDGREYKSESFDFNGSTVLRSSDTTLEQRPLNSGEAWWWTGSADDAPPRDVRTVQTLSTLSDTSQVTVQTMDYDQFNNQTDVYEYDFCPSSNYNDTNKTCSSNSNFFIRRTHTDFVTTNVVDSVTKDYVGILSPATDSIHIRNLPKETWVSSDSGGSTKKSKTTFEYDNYASDSNHAGLISRSSITGLDSGFTTSYKTRGNATDVSRWLLPSVQLTSYQQYDIAGNVVLIKDPRGYSTTATYGDSYGSPDGNATTNTAPSELSGVSQTSYAFATVVTNAANQATKSQFDFYTGMPVDGEDINGVVSSGYSTSEPLDRPTQIIRAVGTSVVSQTTFAYDDTNRIVTTTSDLATYNDNSLKTESLYDGLGRTYETRNYETSSNYIKVTQTYDALGRSKRTYNPFRTTSDPTYGWAENTYDALGRVTTVTSADSTTVSTSYSGNAVTVTDQANKSRRSISDGIGRLIRVDEPDQYGSLGSVSSPNQATNYSYDVLGNLIRVQQGSQNRYFMYDSLGRMLRVSQPEQETNTALNTSGNPDNNSWTAGFTYDDNGNVLTTTDAKNTTITNTYDVLNRALTRTYSDSTPTVTNYYDGAGLPSVPAYSAGKLTRVDSSISDTRYTGFDPAGRLTENKQITGGNTYTSAYQYNRAGAMTQETYPSGRVMNVDYSSVSGDIYSIYGTPSGGSQTTYADNFTYAADKKIQQLKLGNNLWETAVINNRLQVTEFKLGTTQGASNVWSLANEYGELQSGGSVDASKNNGNIAKQTVNFSGLANPFVQGYKYDSLDRISEAKETVNGTQTWIQNWGYDRYGNRSSFTKNVLGNTTVSNPTIDAATNRFNTGQNYTYDKNGNIVDDPFDGGRKFTYNGDNKQTQVKLGKTVIGTYSYDGEGKRVKKVTGSESTVFVYSNGRLVEERNSSTNALVTSYLYAGSQLLATETSTATNYTVTDHLGSPRVVVNGSGTVVSRRDFLPFGEELFADGTYRKTSDNYSTTGTDAVRQRFTGYQKDTETGLDFAEARMYQNQHGRFTAIDPLLASGKSSDPQTFNRYIYSLSAPLVLTDPTGLQSGKKPDDVVRIESQQSASSPQVTKLTSQPIDRTREGYVPVGGKFSITAVYTINAPEAGQKPGDAAVITAVDKTRSVIKDGKVVDTLTEPQAEGSFGQAFDVTQVGDPEVKLGTGKREDEVEVTKTWTFQVEKRKDSLPGSTGQVNFQVNVTDPRQPISTDRTKMVKNGTQPNPAIATTRENDPRTKNQGVKSFPGAAITIVNRPLENK